jgi:tetratricopeptide (TPR) repeat protein
MFADLRFTPLRPFDIVTAVGKANREKEQRLAEASSPQIMVPPRRSFMTQSWPALLFVLLLAILVHLNVLSNGFGWDDEDIIKRLRPPDHGWSLFLSNPTSDPASKEISSYYRPLVSVSYLLDYIIWGRNPFGFHLSVLLAHLLNTGLVFFLAKGLTTWVNPKPVPTHHSNSQTDDLLPLLVASLFAVHPVHAEAVAWIAGRNDVFCTTFILSSMVLYIRFRRTDQEWNFGLSMLFFFFALLTKETAIGLVLLYPLYDYSSEPPTPSHPKQRMGMRFLIPLAILGLYFWMRTRTITDPMGPLSLEHASSPLFTVIGVIGLYLKLMIFPYPQHPFIVTLPRSPIHLFLSGLVLVFLVGGTIWAFSRRYRLIGWGLIWAFAFLAPAIPIALINGPATSAAERYVYAPSIGFLIALGAVVLGALNRLLAKTGWTTRKVWTSAFLLWIVFLTAFGWESWNRNTVWRNTLTFWETAVAASSGNDPREAPAHNNLGVGYKARGRLSESIRELQTAIELKPDYTDAHYNLGVVYEDMGRLNEALQEYRSTLKLKPDDAEAHNSLGNVYTAQKRLEEAVQEYRMAVTLQPDLVEAHNNLGALYADLGRLDDAIQEFQITLKLQPDQERVFYNLGNAYLLKGKNREAAAAFERALEIKPDFRDARKALESLPQ